MTIHRPGAARPLALSDAELREVEDFANRQGLDQIARMCSELRVLRSEYMAQAKRIGRLTTMVNNMGPTPQLRYQQELDCIVNYTGHHTHAS